MDNDSVDSSTAVSILADRRHSISDSQFVTVSFVPRVKCFEKREIREYWGKLFACRPFDPSFLRVTPKHFGGRRGGEGEGRKMGRNSSFLFPIFTKLIRLYFVNYFLNSFNSSLIWIRVINIYSIKSDDEKLLFDRRGSILEREKIGERWIFAKIIRIIKKNEQKTETKTQRKERKRKKEWTIEYARVKNGGLSGNEGGRRKTKVRRSLRIIAQDLIWSVRG